MSVECIGSDSEDGHAGRLRVGKKKVGAHYVDEKGWGCDHPPVVRL